MRIIPAVILLLSVQAGVAQDSTKVYTTRRTTQSMKIDGQLDEEAWKTVPVLSDFIQNSPQEGSAPTQKTEFRILFDDHAVYVGAMMYDSAPDSMLKELGSRDEGGLNSEKFRFVIDPYLTKADAYDFGVYASGVQIDSRFSDWTYNGVWHSAVKILDNGWSVELKIPYSAIRFPNTPVQRWGLQVTRDIRRNREFDQWALTPSGKANGQKYWGTLEGITDIKPPIRLSLTPYLSSYIESSPSYNADGSFQYRKAFSYNAGADIKVGLDERYTLDMTLLPDFGQVQSDNKVKNLSYREISYEDYRPFFKEGTDLFNKGGLFYSRRIGKTPTMYYSVPYMLDSGETILKNPAQAKLLNATKVSGRNNNGLGIGLFNAITDNTYAEIQTADGGTRKIKTEPFTNYNIVALDQQLKNSSNLYFLNTNVIRQDNDYRDANVTGMGFGLQNKKNTWLYVGESHLSQLFNRIDSLPDHYENEMGYFYQAAIRKISGAWQGGIQYETMSPHFNRSDMGYYADVNYSSYNFNVSYNRYKPWKFLLRSFNNLYLNYSHNYETGLPTNIFGNLNLFFISKANWGVWGGFSTSPVSAFDYYEPRVAGRYFRTGEWYFANAGFSTNYVRRFALDLSGNTGNFTPWNIHGFPQEQGYNINFKPRYRFNDKFTVTYNFNYNFDPLNPGFANFDSLGNPIFGGRELNTYINTLSAKYIIKNDLSFTLNARHYWNTGEYRFYYDLLDNGMLKLKNDYTGNDNFSYNAFNVDMVFSWQFAPGSILTIVYKNAIEKGDVIIPHGFGDNLDHVLRSPQTNSLSLKILYYLDYQDLRKKQRS